MKYLPLLLVFILFSCGSLNNLQKLQHPNHTILSPKNVRPATVYFPNVVPISKPYVKGPILTERIEKHNFDSWVENLSRTAAEKSFDAVIVIEQLTGTSTPCSEGKVCKPYLMITYLCIWYAKEEFLPKNLMRSVSYRKYSTRENEVVATAYFGLNGKLYHVDGDLDKYERFQSVQGWYYAGNTHHNWYHSTNPYYANYRVDKSNPKKPIIYNRHAIMSFNNEMKNNVLRIDNRKAVVVSYITSIMFEHGPQTEYILEYHKVYKNKFDIDANGRILSQQIYLVCQLGEEDVLVASAEYEYYRFEDLPEEYIVRPAITGI